MQLLQMSSDPGTLMVYLCIAIVVLFIYVIIIRWIFRIDRQIENQRAMIWLLMQLCEKNGLTQEQLENFKRSFKIK